MDDGQPIEPAEDDKQSVKVHNADTVLVNG